MKPFFSDKIIFEEKEVAETLNNCFANVIKSLNINILSEARSSNEVPLNVDDPIEAIIIKYSNHPRIKRTNKNVKK